MEDLTSCVIERFEDVILQPGILRSGPGGASVVYRRVVCSHTNAMSQFNPTHQATKRLRIEDGAKRPTVYEDFNHAGFSFLKISSQECLFTLSDTGINTTFTPHPSGPPAAGTTDEFPDAVVVNVSPIFRHHSLYIPRVRECHPQYLTPFATAAAAAFSARARSLVVGYNSLAAWASVNHLHFQIFPTGGVSGIPRTLPIFAAPAHPLLVVLPRGVHGAAGGTSADGVPAGPGDGAAPAHVAVVSLVGGPVAALRVDVVPHAHVPAACPVPVVALAAPAAAMLAHPPAGTASVGTATDAAAPAASTAVAAPHAHTLAPAVQAVMRAAQPAIADMCPTAADVAAAAATVAAAAAPLGAFDPATIDVPAAFYEASVADGEGVDSARGAAPAGASVPITATAGGDACWHADAVHAIVPPPAAPWAPCSGPHGLRVDVGLPPGGAPPAPFDGADAGGHQRGEDAHAQPAHGAAHGLLGEVMTRIASVACSTFQTPRDADWPPRARGARGGAADGPPTGSGADVAPAADTPPPDGVGVAHTVFFVGGTVGVFVPRRTQRDDVTYGHLQTAMAETAGVAICNTRAMYERTCGAAARGALTAYSLTGCEMAAFVEAVVGALVG